MTSSSPRKSFTRAQLLAVLGADAVANLEAKVVIATSRSMTVPNSTSLAATKACISGKRKVATTDYYKIGRSVYVWLQGAEQQRSKSELIAWCETHINQRQADRIKEVQG